MEKEIDRVRYGAFQPITRDMRDAVGQGVALAALGGFRGLAANVLWFQVTEAWEKCDWARLRSRVEMAVQLQPRVPFFWEMGAWHLAWNASLAAEGDTALPLFQRKAEAQQRLEEGQRLLERGVLLIPESADLWMYLGDLHWQRTHDYLKAGYYYEEGSHRWNAPPYAKRLAGFAYEKSGNDQAAYDYYMRLWNSVKEHPHGPPSYWEAIEKNIQKFEERLNIPLEKRVGSKVS